MLIHDKLQILKIQDAGRPPLKIVKTLYLREKTSDFGEIWHTLADHE